MTPLEQEVASAVNKSGKVYYDSFRKIQFVLNFRMPDDLKARKIGEILNNCNAKISAIVAEE